MARMHTNTGSRRKYARYLAHYTRKNHTLLLLGAVFLVSVVLGTLLYRGANSVTLTALSKLVDTFLLNRGDGTLYQNFMAALGSAAVYLGALFVCGFCAIAQPVIVVTPFFRGLGFGFFAASLYARYGTNAMGYLGVLVLPGMLVTTVAVLLCCQQSMRLANSFLATLRPSAKGVEPYPLRQYAAGYIFAGLLCVGAAFLEAVLYSAFANSFYLG